MKKRIISILLLLSLVFIVSCQTSVSQDELNDLILSTINSYTVVPTYTELPTQTPYPTYTNFPTQTPWIQIVTPENTATPKFTSTNTLPPTETFTPTLTNTATPVPGVGADIKCGNYFNIKVTEKPISAGYVYGERPNGLFYIIKFQITNTTTETINIWTEYFTLGGIADGKTFTYEVDDDATWEYYWASRYSIDQIQDEIGGGLTSSRIVVFDVNPDLKNLIFYFTPKDNLYDSSSLCKAKIPLN